ncbi:MAG: hypothetical protein ACTSP4_07290 [Candidatus Hodarchaeales archaeon]
MENNHFTFKFAEKDTWHEFKEDLKGLFKNIGVKYQFSVDSPVFYLVYKSERIKTKISWIESGLTIELRVSGSLSYEEKETLTEIYDLLLLCDGELLSGTRPEEWG